MKVMRIGTLRRGRAQEAAPGVAGTVRLDRRTKNLTKRLRPGDIAVIDHVDIDRVSADALVGCRVAAVVNAAPSISGRYPNLGPEILVSAGIPLLDGVGRRGDEIIITKRGRPIAQIGPIRPDVPELKGMYAGRAKILGDIVNFNVADEWEAAR